MNFNLHKVLGICNIHSPHQNMRIWYIKIYPNIDPIFFGVIYVIVGEINTEI